MYSSAEDIQLFIEQTDDTPAVVVLSETNLTKQTCQAPWCRHALQEYKQFHSTHPE
jgi:hypothetical protein